MGAGRLIARALTCLAAGAVLNLIVAWTCALAPPVFPGRDVGNDPRDTRWALDAPPNFRSRASRFLMADSGPGRARSTYNELVWRGGPDSADIDDDQTYTVCVVDCGWPLYSLWYRRFDGAPAGADQATAARLRDGILLDAASRSARDAMVLPVMPRWGGLAVDSAALGAVPWAAAAALSWARRRGRERRGLCGACGYPAGVSAVCTECGAPLAPRKPGPATPAVSH